MHITPAPEAFIRVEVAVPDEKDLIPLTGILTDMLRRRIITQSPSVTSLLGLIAPVMHDPAVQAKLLPYHGKNIPESVLLEIRALKKLPFWMGLFSLYGTQEVVEAQLATLTREFATKTFGRATITSKLFSCPPGEKLPADIIGEDPEFIPQTGRPTLASLAVLNGGGHATFAPLIPPSGRELYDWYLEAKEVASAAGFNFLADFHLYGRYVIAIGLIMFQPQVQGPSIHSMLTTLTDLTIRKGFSEYRTHVSFMDEVAAHYGFNQRSLARLTQRIKDLLDPRGILSPGKQGVWNSEDSGRDVEPKPHP